MSRTAFYTWLSGFNDYTAQNSECQVLLLVDNASVHGTVSDIPMLSNAPVCFLPRKTTSILQPLDQGIIACMKRRYVKKQVRGGLDLIQDENLSNIYTVDTKQGMQWINEIWEEVENDIIFNC